MNVKRGAPASERWRCSGNALCHWEVQNCPQRNGVRSCSWNCRRYATQWEWGSWSQKNHDVQIQAVTYWTDYMSLLQWLYSSHESQQLFVTNKDVEVLDQSTLDGGQHVSGTMNPADISTRGSHRVTVAGKRMASWAGLAETEPKQLDRRTKTCWWRWQ